MQAYLFDLFLAGLCGVTSAALVVAVLHPRVPDGVVIKSGLILAALGFGALALRLFNGYAPDEQAAIERAGLMIIAGCVVVTIGVGARIAARRRFDPDTSHAEEWRP